ncbi:MAG: DUF349 domain-containing protein [Bacteroidales bacterium]|nr:DUF349 domain-containing protein [Bacteroidales bacterium]
MSEEIINPVIEENSPNQETIVAPAEEPVVEPIEAVAEPITEVAEPVAESSEETVAEAEEPVAEVSETAAEESEEDYSKLSLSELIDQMQGKVSGPDVAKRSNQIEAIRACFYKLLSKEKEVEAASAAALEEVQGAFEKIEEKFKDLYGIYKKERARIARELEAVKEENLVAKKQIIEELKELIDSGDSVASFQAFKALQERWRAAGSVPASEARNINETYQFHVTRFYEQLDFNHELRDKDFAKNLEEKTSYCEKAEELAKNENASEAFRELQKLHEAWKDLGPVAKEFRDSIWDRFKAATAEVNKNYQAFIDTQKENFAKNLEAKTLLCEAVEKIAEVEDAASAEWNNLSKQIEDIQAEWKKIGFAAKKDNQKIYERFRAACDKFYEKKRLYYAGFKDAMNENYEKKVALCEQVEALKNSTEWKKTTDTIIALQKQWKEIGAVPRKKSEAIWKRFRSACDEFFAERDKKAKENNELYTNLKAKKALVEKINAYELTGNEADDQAALKGFQDEWAGIGFVPFREKDKISAAYKEAIGKFPRSNRRPSGQHSRPLSERERLTQLYYQKEQEIATYENNIGFFSGKGSEAIIEGIRQNLEKAKANLKEIEEQIRNLAE